MSDGTNPSAIYYPSLNKNRYCLTSTGSSELPELLEATTPPSSPTTSTQQQQPPASPAVTATKKQSRLLASPRMSSGLFRRPFLSLSSNNSSVENDSFDSDCSGPSVFRNSGPMSGSRRGSRARLASCTSTDGSSSNSSSGNANDLAAAKSNYRILVLGACRTGKTSIIRQFLYDQFSPSYKETVDDMYRGEFDIHGHSVGFDIQDVSGGYVYEFPGMRNVSLSSADAFILVFGMDDAASWDEVNRLRDMIHEVKDPEVPIVVVGNKCDLEAADPDIPRESLEATVTFDWENGYVESSAKERRNINKIFKELLQQAKAKYDFTVPQLVSASALVSDMAASSTESLDAVNLKRRQSMPAVPAGFAPLPPTPKSAKDHGPFFKYPQAPEGGGGGGSKRRSSLAALRRDSCKIS